VPIEQGLHAIDHLDHEFLGAAFGAELRRLDEANSMPKRAIEARSTRCQTT
jgi:hypothetical protein